MLRIFEHALPRHLQAPLRGYGALLFARLVGLRRKLRPAIRQRFSGLPQHTSCRHKCRAFAGAGTLKH